MKNFILIFCLVSISCSFSAKAQFESATLGVNGLTCSMCQKSVEKSLYRLKFIQSIETNLEETTLHITFKPGAEVSFAELAQKVKSAGFSVRDLEAVYNFHQYTVADNSNFTYDKATYRFVKTNNKTLEGKTTVRLVGSDFMTKDEYKNYASSVTTPYNALAPVYYITIPQ